MMREKRSKHGRSRYEPHIQVSRSVMPRSGQVVTGLNEPTRQRLAEAHIHPPPKPPHQFLPDLCKSGCETEAETRRGRKSQANHQRRSQLQTQAMPLPRGKHSVNEVPRTRWKRNTACHRDPGEETEARIRRLLIVPPCVRLFCSGGSHCEPSKGQSGVRH